MNIHEFNADIAKRVLELWKEHMGVWHGVADFRKPNLLVYSLNDPDYWIGGRFEDRIGSRYSDDSKLLAYLNDGKLHFECYAQPNALTKDIRKEAEKAEDAFNKAVREYIDTSANSNNGRARK